MMDHPGGGCPGRRLWFVTLALAAAPVDNGLEAPGGRGAGGGAPWTLSLEPLPEHLGCQSPAAGTGEAPAT